MSEEIQTPEAVVPAKSPFEYLAEKYPSAPSEALVQSYKAQVPGGRVRLFELPDGKRAVILRAISPLELAAIQSEVSKLLPEKQLFELQVSVTTKCTLWASFTKSGKLTDIEVRAAGAGLPVTLHAVVWDLSDYIDPAVIDNLSVDL